MFSDILNCELVTLARAASAQIRFFSFHSGIIEGVMVVKIDIAINTLLHYFSQIKMLRLTLGNCQEAIGMLRTGVTSRQVPDVINCNHSTTFCLFQRFQRRKILPIAQDVVNRELSPLIKSSYLIARLTVSLLKCKANSRRDY